MQGWLDQEEIRGWREASVAERDKRTDSWLRSRRAVRSAFIRAGVGLNRLLAPSLQPEIPTTTI
jgi:hypothetical protein